MSHLAAILTQEQKDQLVGQKWTDDTFFNPIQDCNDNWVISEDEVQGNTNTNVSWVNSLTLTDYCHKIPPPITGTSGSSGSSGTSGSSDFMGI